MSAWSIELRSPRQQADFERLRAVLTSTLGLDWRGMAGEPDGGEIAEECAEELWIAGFRVTPPNPIDLKDGREPADEPDGAPSVDGRGGHPNPPAQAALEREVSSGVQVAAKPDAVLLYLDTLEGTNPPPDVQAVIEQIRAEHVTPPE